MNTRILAVMTAVTLLSLSSGCCMKNFVFGRGARCGLCNKMSSVIPRPQFGNTMQAPCGQTPYVSTPAYGPAAPQGVVTAPSCGCNNYAGNTYLPETYSGGTCHSCRETYEQGCGMEGYSSIVTDPYMSSGPVIEGSSVPYSQPGYPQAYPDASYPVAPVPSDNFNARKFDSDGNRILWEEPLPSGSRAL